MYFLGYAFRPFFLLAIAHAIFGVSWWSVAWMGWGIAVPSLAGSPVFWHAHEMVSGFVGAAIGGFVLTAVANWTRRPPVSGLVLALLCLLWVVARIAGTWSSPWAAIADIGYWTALTGLVAREVVAGRSWRNAKVVALLGVLALADFAVHASAQWAPALIRQSLHAQLWLVAGLILVIGGRIVPAFTRNWLVTRAGPNVRLPPDFDGFDLAGNICVAAFLVAVFTGAPGWVSAPLGVGAAVLTLVRLLRWQGWRTAQDPLVWVLHVGFLWLPVAMMLWALSTLGMLPVSAAVHALTVGAMSTMILAVAARAALGHTNRPLRTTPAVTAAYLFITVAAVLRVLASAVPGWHVLLQYSALAWLGAFIAFAWRYVPVLIGPAPAESVEQAR